MPWTGAASSNLGAGRSGGTRCGAAAERAAIAGFCRTVHTSRELKLEVVSVTLQYTHTEIDRHRAAGLHQLPHLIKDVGNHNSEDAFVDTSYLR
jgi:hypothetical protein